MPPCHGLISKLRIIRLIFPTEAVVCPLLCDGVGVSTPHIPAAVPSSSARAPATHRNQLPLGKPGRKQELARAHDPSVVPALHRGQYDPPFEVRTV